MNPTCKEFVKLTAEYFHILDEFDDEVEEEEEENGQEELVLQQLAPSQFFYSSPICSFRRALDSDLPEIEALVTHSSYEVFGPKTIEYKIKKCYFSMVAVNADNRIVAVIVLDDYPNLPAVPKSEWETWIKNLYSLQNLTAQNTLWINFIAVHSSYIYSFAKPLLEHVYLNFPFLIHLVVIVPGNSPCFCFLEENFTCVMPVGYLNPKKVQTLYLTLRQHYIQKYKIRLAVEEDNDDIVQIIDTHSKKLKDMYGEYYVSEILTKFPEMSRKIIVAEIAERAVGVLFLNDDVNYDSINMNFNLEPFSNLHNLSDDAVVKEKDYPVSLSIVEPDFEAALIRTYSKDSGGAEPPFCPGEPRLYIDDDMITLSDIFDLEKLGILADGSLCVQDDVQNISSNPIVEEDDADNNFNLKIMTSILEYPTISRSVFQFLLPCQQETAFSLEIMAAGEEHELGVICDLLEASFQSFTVKPKDYCVFSVLHTQSHFPLFDFFVRTIPRRNTLYPQEFYVLHRNAIKATLEVRKLSKREYKEVKQLVCHIVNATAVVDAITRSLYGAKNNFKTYIMANSSVIIGLIIVNVEKYPEHYFENYKISKYLTPKFHRYDKCGLIEFCIISPIFQRHMQFFLKEVHRLTDMSILFYKMPRTELFQKTRVKPLPGILKDMLPVLDRAQPNFSRMSLDDIEIPHCLLDRKREQFSLFISTRRLCSLPRLDVNSRIVVVGSSCTGLSFLEKLIFHYDGTRHLNFNNLYLIYDRALRDSSGISKYIPYMFLYRGKFTGNHINSMCFHTHVNYVNGFMTAINRKMKYIQINKDSIVPYDYLFLMCGEQYHQPFAAGVRRDKCMESCPLNVFIINNYNDAEAAFSKIHSHLRYKKNPTIVVYGSSLNCYGCITALEKTKFPNFNIKFVEPVPDEFERPSMDPFNNPEIFDAFHDILFIIGVEVYSGYYFYEWEVNNSNYVTNVKYQSRKGAISFNCDFIFHYANKEVNFETFSALNNAGLVYDGKLVIGPDCKTNDPFIYAAGPMTKYSRRYFADRFHHKYYNSHEIGERLGKQIRSMLIPGGLTENFGDQIFDILNQEDTNKLVPQYTQPLIVNFTLPGGINFLDIHNPGKPSPLETQKTGHVFETGNLKKVELEEDPEYFRLQLNEYMKVEQIVCFTRKEIDVTNFQRLWGMHEMSLNNLVQRYKKGMIKNLYTFFRNPYFCAIYLDRFSDLKRQMDNIMVLLTSKKGKSIIEDIVQKLLKNNWTKLTVEQDSRVKNKFTKSPYQRQIVEEIMKFLEDHADYLPMYAHPLITKIILYDVETSPLFKKSDEDLSTLSSETST